MTYLLHRLSENVRPYRGWFGDWRISGATCPPPLVTKTDTFSGREQKGKKKKGKKRKSRKNNSERERGRESAGEWERRVMGDPRERTNRRPRHSRPPSPPLLFSPLSRSLSLFLFSFYFPLSFRKVHKLSQRASYLCPA